MKFYYTKSIPNETTGLPEIRVWTVDKTNTSSSMVKMSEEEWDVFRQRCYTLGIRFNWV